MKKWILISVSVLLAAVLVCAVLFCQAPIRYQLAEDKMSRGDYAAASEAYASLNGYRDSQILALYADALASGEAGEYGNAAAALEQVGALLTADSALKTDIRICGTYYAALDRESRQEYEEAAELLADIREYRDVPERLASYPEKILQREYDIAFFCEGSALYEEALRIYDSLGDFSDAAERAEKMRQLLAEGENAEKQARYDEADALEEAGEAEKALAVFEALGDFSDASDRAAAIREQLRLAEEQARLEAEAAAAAEREAENQALYESALEKKEQGQYRAARKIFLELGAFSDSAARAEELKEPALYEEAGEDIKAGKYAEAYALYASLGTYEDSAALAYLSRVGEFSSETAKLTDHTGMYRFHDLWGFVNFETKQLLEPAWDIYRVLADGSVIIRTEERYGLLSAEGAEIFAPAWEDYMDLGGSELAIVTEQVGLVRTDGTVLAEPKWNTFYGLDNSFAVIQGDTYTGPYALLNYRTLEQTGFDYDGISDTAANGFFMTSGETEGQTLYGLLGTDLRELLPCEYAVIGTQRSGDPEAPVFENGLIRVQNAVGQWGYADRTGIVIPAAFDELGAVVNHFAAYRLGSTRGFIREDGQFRIDPLYDEVQDFNAEGYAEVMDENGHWQIIDTEGNLLYFTDEAYLAAAAKEKAEGREAALEAWQAANGKADSGRRVKSVYYSQAAEALTAGDYAEAARLYGLAEGYADSAKMVRVSEHLEGLDLMLQQRYEEAIACFERAGDYADAKEEILICKYEWARALRNGKQYDEAEQKFAELGDYEDAKDQITETRYMKAMDLDEQGKYKEAYEIFKDMKDYKLVSGILKREEYLKFQAKVGDIITFGTYPQTATGNDNTPIEWRVLEINENKALLISRYGLDVQPYCSGSKEATWQTSSLRTWLNFNFIDRAFSSTEKTAILTVDVDNSSNQGYADWKTDGGKNTKDKVFLLSYAEANKYFRVTKNGNNNKTARVEPTAYAIVQGAYTTSKYTTGDGKEAGWWWLRSPGSARTGAARVYVNGALDIGIISSKGIVRPAIWVDLNVLDLD